MTVARSVTATFAAAPPTPTTYTLTVTKAGTGSGIIGSSPAGVYCSTTCSVSFQSGTTVTLAAVTTTGSTFTGWSGACTGTGVCTITLTKPQAVTATFATSTPTGKPSP